MSAIKESYDRTTHKKCIKCRKWKPRSSLVLEDGTEVRAGFGKHESSSDGLQSICFTCKNKANNEARNRNITARIRHHTATRCLTQLGGLAPEGFVADLENYLGYKIRALVKHLGQDLKDREGPNRKLKDALAEGYHIDHKRPLSSFPVVNQDTEEVDWDIFRACWDPTNLSAIPAEENLAKGAKYDATASREEETQEDAAQEEVRAITSTPEINPESRA